MKTISHDFRIDRSTDEREHAALERWLGRQGIRWSQILDIEAHDRKQYGETTEFTVTATLVDRAEDV
jgi:hypothetical protein